MVRYPKQLIFRIQTLCGTPCIMYIALQIFRSSDIHSSNVILMKESFDYLRTNYLHDITKYEQLTSQQHTIPTAPLNYVNDFANAT